MPSSSSTTRRATVPSGTGITMSFASLPEERAPEPFSPSSANWWRWYFRWISVQYCLSPTSTTLPPLAAVAAVRTPEGHELLTTEVCAEPAPPCPERAKILT